MKYKLWFLYVLAVLITGCENTEYVKLPNSVINAQALFTAKTNNEDNGIISQGTTYIKLDWGAPAVTKIFESENTINEISNIINYMALVPVAEEDKFKLYVSSVAGSVITSNDSNLYININGAVGIMQMQSNTVSGTYYIDQNTLDALNNILYAPLPAELVEGEPYTNASMLTDEAVKPLITKYLTDSGFKGAVSTTLTLENITPKSLWENSHTQLYKISLDYATLYGVAIVNDGAVASILQGMPTNNVYIADLNSDGIYEIYADVSFGSGMVSNEIIGYNPQTNASYHISGRKEGIDYYLESSQNILYIKSTPMNSSKYNGDADAKWSKPVIEWVDGKETLSIIPYDLGDAEKYKNLRITGSKEDMVYIAHPLQLNHEEVPSLASGQTMHSLLMENMLSCSGLPPLRKVNWCEDKEMLTLTFPKNSLPKSVVAYAGLNTDFLSSICYLNLPLVIQDSQIQFSRDDIKNPMGVIYTIVAEWENGDKMMYELLLREASE